MDLRSSSDADQAAVIWKGKTPSGYAVVVARDERQRWVATVAGASRSRNGSLEAALIEAGGSAVSRLWAARVAAVINARMRQ